VCLLKQQQVACAMAAMVRSVRPSSGGKAVFLRQVKRDLGPVTGPNLQCEMDQPWSAGMGKLALSVRCLCVYYGSVIAIVMLKWHSLERA